MHAVVAELKKKFSVILQNLQFPKSIINNDI